MATKYSHYNYSFTTGKYNIFTNKYLTITYSTFPFPEIVVMPYVFVAGAFLHESYDNYSHFSFSYCRNIVGENIFLDILLGVLLTAVASAMFKTFLFRMFEFGASNN